MTDRRRKGFVFCGVESIDGDQDTHSPSEDNDLTTLERDESKGY